MNYRTSVWSSIGKIGSGINTSRNCKAVRNSSVQKVVNLNTSSILFSYNGMLSLKKIPNS